MKVLIEPPLFGTQAEALSLSMVSWLNVKSLVLTDGSIYSKGGVIENPTDQDICQLVLQGWNLSKFGDDNIELEMDEGTGYFEIIPVGHDAYLLKYTTYDHN